jgi:hypothetical protein
MFVMTYKPTMLSTLLESVCRHCRPFLKRNIVLAYRVTPPDAYVKLDPRRVFQIITNGLCTCRRAAL